MKVSWSASARADVRGIRRYIAQDSPFYARQFCERLIAAVEKLVEHPRLGRLVPEAEGAGAEVRELVFRDYRILYLVTDEPVQILAVIHGARDLLGLERKPWE